MVGDGLWTILASVAGTLAVTYFGHHLGISRDQRARQDELDRRGRYLAIRVVCVLDPFVSECCDVVLDPGFEDNEGYTHARMEMPTIKFPEDVDWKAIKPELMYRILGLPNEIEEARQSVRFVADEIAGPPDFQEYFEERTVQYAKLGLEASKLAADLRTEFGIGANKRETWNPEEILERELSKQMKKRDEAAKRWEERHSAGAVKGSPSS